MLLSMLNPNQKQALNLFQSKPDNEKAQQIADYCNKNNITKEQLQNIINSFRK